ncbi:hypothetical protein TCDM_12879 [Trypanosoma cruzi Dm28c]|uniref:Uncharacterized protein n=1 Tax=Trypanosoma cruzi Dm28c TaxID=1416333 RepID=V5CJU7_TRYCR|nr:hypothetical protein TCDM_12879 [Trypanosoma cruzi Dm28c]
MSCRHSAPIMSTTPSKYSRTCSMRCNHPRIRLAVMHCSLLSLWLEQTHTSSQSTAWCCKRLSRSTMRVKFPDVRKQRPPSYISAHSTHPHTRAVPWGRETQRTAHAQINMHQQRHPRRTATEIHAHSTNTAATNGMHPTQQRGRSLLPSPADWSHTLTVRHGAHNPLPPSALSRPASSHPRAIAMRNTSNRRRGPSVPLAGKKKE